MAESSPPSMNTTTDFGGTTGLADTAGLDTTNLGDTAGFDTTSSNTTPAFGTGMGSMAKAWFSSSMLIWGVVIVLLLGLLGAGYWWWRKRKGAKKGPGDAAVSPEADPAPTTDPLPETTTESPVLVTPLPQLARPAPIQPTLAPNTPTTTLPTTTLPTTSRPLTTVGTQAPIMAPTTTPAPTTTSRPLITTTPAPTTSEDETTPAPKTKKPTQIMTAAVSSTRPRKTKGPKPAQITTAAVSSTRPRKTKGPKPTQITTAVTSSSETSGAMSIDTTTPAPAVGKDKGGNKGKRPRGTTKASRLGDKPAGLKELKYEKTKGWVLTWYSFQDNTPSNSLSSASGRTLIPFVSVAVPFRLLKKFGGKLDYGDKLFVEFLRGRKMPNGKEHTGWVQIDDFCGDNDQDDYCFQKIKGTKYPNIDIFIGDITKSGQDTKSSKCGGPVGTGQEQTMVYTGPVPEGEFTLDYGGAARNNNKCGDAKAGKRDHGKCYYYAAKNSKEELSWCK